MSFFLTVSTGPLHLEYYARDCEFCSLQKKTKKLLAVFLLNVECPKFLCGLGIGQRRRQTIPVRNSSGENNSSGHHCMSGIYKIEHSVMTW